MDFPLYVHTYELNGRIYRRSPYKGFRSDVDAELRGGDTLDLYADDQEPYCDEEDRTVDVGADEPSSQQHDLEEGYETMANSSAAIGPAGPAFGPSALDGTDPLKSTTKNEPTGNDPSATIVAAQMSGILFDSRSKKWSTRVDIPNEMISMIIGAKGSTKRKLEAETDCRLLVPSANNRTANCANYVDIVSTKSEESVERCRDRIELLLMGARERSAFTHFVAIPMNSADIRNTFMQFVELVQNDDELPASCREPCVFQEAPKLHLTLVMLSLLNKTEITKASEALERVVEQRVKKLVGDSPLEVEMHGLEYMNDDPTRVRVLYAKAYSQRLQDVANAIADGIGDMGLAPRRMDHVKIHCTLMNSRYAIEKGKETNEMDVRKLMEKYGEFYFGHTTVSEVHIWSRVDAKDESGCYASIASLKLC